MRIITVSVVAAMMLAAGGARCSSASSPTQPSTAAGPETSAAPAPAPDVTATARYRVVFESTWSAASHPTDFPAGAHYSRLVGGAHSSGASFWREGGFATEGIRLMAERGAVTPLDTEITKAIAAGMAQRVLIGPALGTSPGSVSMEFEISRDFPLVTLVTMVAPSPDWFVGVSGLMLLSNGGWVEELETLLSPYDAGTDSGASYTSSDQETTPRRPIGLLQGYPVGAPGSTLPFGRFRFTRLSSGGLHVQ